MTDGLGTLNRGDKQGWPNNDSLNEPLIRGTGQVHGHLAIQVHPKRTITLNRLDPIAACRVGMGQTANKIRGSGNSWLGTIPRKEDDHD
jgi:hypothetical protein